MFSRWGLCLSVDSDQGIHFTFSILTTLFNILGVEVKFHIPYHPRNISNVQNTSLSTCSRSMFIAAVRTGMWNSTCYWWPSGPPRLTADRPSRVQTESILFKYDLLPTLWSAVWLGITFGPSSQYNGDVLYEACGLQLNPHITARIISVPVHTCFRSALLANLQTTAGKCKRKYCPDFSFHGYFLMSYLSSCWKP